MTGTDARKIVKTRSPKLPSLKLNLHGLLKDLPIALLEPTLERTELIQSWHPHKPQKVSFLGIAVGRFLIWHKGNAIFELCHLPVILTEICRTD